MINELLPIGSIVEIENKELAMIAGYFGDSGEKSYNVFPYPFSLDGCVSINSVNIKTIKKLKEKYTWFTTHGSVSAKSITRVLFWGYRDNSFYDLKNKIGEFFE